MITQRTQDGRGAVGINGRVKYLPLAWAWMPKTCFRKNSDSPNHGRTSTFPYLSAHHLLESPFSSADLEEAVVLIGASAQGILDLRNSPLEANMPGVEIHANMISGILNDNLYSEPPWANAVNLVVLVVTGLFLTLTLPFFAAGKQIVTAMFVFVLLIFSNFWLWSAEHLVLNLAPQILLVLMLAVFNGFNSHLKSVRRERRIKGIFSQYIPPQLVHEMSEGGDDGFSLDSKTKELSVLFADIRGFTTISESLHAHDR